MSRPKRPGKFKYLNVAIPEELSDRLDLYIKESRLSKTAVTEIAITEYLDRNQQEKH